ncbi:MAG: sigma-70 family RNA polymerase sigma factor [Muribaculaceae bacterium]|nr:sigma-70 family RNA polymerase sigma factor [Muribaculaceae bacterium]
MTLIERLFRDHYRQLLRLARMLLHDDELARDIVHDVFMALLSGGKDANVSIGFLINSVRNRCLNHIRDASVSQRLISLYYMDTEEYEDEEWPDEETIKEIYFIIQSELTPRCRHAMNLRFVEGLKFSEVATAMDISEVAVYGHVRRAIEIIRKKLNENGKL